MEERLARELNKEDSQFESEMRRHVKSLIDLSYDFMHSNFHDQWESNLYNYRSQRCPDEQDRKAAKRKEPMKMIIPLTYSQVDTFVAFCYTLFTQRETFFELVANGAEDELGKLIAESVMERDLLSANWYGDKLTQFLKDVALFNLGVLKHTWTEKSEQETQTYIDEETGATQVETVDVTTFQGNDVLCINPFRFLPDPRLPITRFQEGEFVGSISEYSRHQLEMLKKQGRVAGLQHVDQMTEACFNKKWLSIGYDQYTTYYKNGWEGVNPPYALTEIQLNIIPNEWRLDDGTLLGEEDYPVKYVVWLLNDQRIIFMAPLNYPHNQFTYDLGVYDYDQNTFLGISLAQLLEQLQNTATWFINSRITSVRKVIDNRFIVDPKSVEMADLKSRSPAIRVKPAMSGFGVDGMIKQLQVQDVTANHLNDVNYLESAASRATGITENLMGLFATGRRSAAEARSVNSNATARLRKVAAGIWNNALRPLGKKMLTNLRAGMDVEQLVQIIGEVKFQENLAGVREFMHVNRQDFEAQFDFKIFDGTLPSEKNLVAEGLGESLYQILQNPQLAQMMQINVQELYFEYLRMKGVKNVERFRMVEGTTQPAGAMGGTPNNQDLLQAIIGEPRTDTFGSAQSGVGFPELVSGEGTADRGTPGYI